MPMYDEDSDYLQHYGVLGMRWGITRTKAQLARTRRGPHNTISLDGPDSILLNSKTIPKGTIVSRISYGEQDRNKYTRKYVSLSDEPEDVWKEAVGKPITAEQGKAYEHQYALKKDLKIASGKDVKKAFDEMMSDPRQRSAHEMLSSMTLRTMEKHGYRSNGDAFEDFCASMIVDPFEVRMFNLNFIQSGYDAIPDLYGLSTGGEQSIIVLAPDKSLKQTHSSKTRYD